MKHLFILLLLLQSLSAEERSDQKSFLLLKNKKSNADVIRLGQNFLRDHKGSANRTEVKMMVALAYYEKGELKLAANYFGSVITSTNAFKSGHVLKAVYFYTSIREQLKLDKFETYTSLNNFIIATAPVYKTHKDKSSPESLKLWRALNATHMSLSKDPEVIKAIHTRKNR